MCGRVVVPHQRCEVALAESRPLRGLDVVHEREDALCLRRVQVWTPRRCPKSTAYMMCANTSGCQEGGGVSTQRANTCVGGGVKLGQVWPVAQVWPRPRCLGQRANTVLTLAHGPCVELGYTCLLRRAAWRHGGLATGQPPTGVISSHKQVRVARATRTSRVRNLVVLGRRSAAMGKKGKEHARDQIRSDQINLRAMLLDRSRPLSSHLRSL